MELASAVAPRAKWLVVGAVAVLLATATRAAWVAEDAYITLRTVDNFVHGHGLRWNVAERVQGYTHPLWMFALSALYFVTREHFLTTLALGLATTTLAVLLLVKLARSMGHALAAIALLAMSKSFVDFSTSGLENPLSHLLLAVFVWLYVVRGSGLRELALVTAGIALNRSDAVLLVAPALVHAGVVSLRERGPHATAKDAAIGLSPWLAWEAFSLFYYGFLFPNTAYAKLNTGLPKLELAKQGATYFLQSFGWDTPGLSAIGLGCVLALARRNVREVMLATGIALYSLYLLRIGGDFMLGRFFTPPLFLAACIVARTSFELDNPLTLTALLAPFVVLFVHPSMRENYRIGDFMYSGVADERAHFREASGLTMFTRTTELPNHPWALEGRQLRESGAKLHVTGNVGLLGFQAGPGVYIIDRNGLTDPLLARLPIRDDEDWRVGHYERALPPGYTETVEQGKCMMDDAKLCAFYEVLHTVVAGDLFSLARIRTLLAMNVGVYDTLIDFDRYRYPERAHEALEAVSSPLPEAAPWNAPEARIFNRHGIELELARPAHAKRMEIMLDGNDEYELEFRQGRERLGVVRAPSRATGNLHTHRIAIPKAAVARGFDRLVVRPDRGDGFYSVGFVRLHAQ